MYKTTRRAEIETEDTLGKQIAAGRADIPERNRGAGMRRTAYYRVLAPLVGLLAASLSLLVVGPGTHGKKVCGPSWSGVTSGEHLTKPRAIAPIASNDIWVVGSTKKGRAT